MWTLLKGDKAAKHGGAIPFYRAVLACLLGVACGGALAQESGLTKVMQLLAAVKTSSVRFTETKHMAALSEPLTLSGRLSYVRGGPVEKDVDAPYEERITVDGETLVIASPARGESRSYALGGAPAAWAFVEGLRATLGGDLATLERYYRVSFGGSVEDWTLTLAPRDEEMARYIESIVFSGRRADITTIRISETGGNTTLTTIRPGAP